MELWLSFEFLETTVFNKNYTFNHFTLLFWNILRIKLMIKSVTDESESHSVMSDSLWPCRLYSPWNSPGQNTGMGSLSILQGMSPTQRSNPALLPCRWILYQLSHKGSLRIMGVGRLSLLQGISATQESNKGLLTCRQILYQLSYQGSPWQMKGLVIRYNEVWGFQKEYLFCLREQTFFQRILLKQLIGLCLISAKMWS